MKWLLVIGACILACIILYLIGNKSVHSEVKLSSSPSEVWAVLTNTDDFPEWNSVFRVENGSLLEGETIVYKFQQDAQTAYSISTKVKELKTQEHINQAGGIPGVLTFDHHYMLEPIQDGTKLTVHETYRGVGVPFWNPKEVQLAYDRLCDDIERRLKGGDHE